MLKEFKTENSAGSFYDRIAGVYDVTFKFNGYGRSLEKYLGKHLPHLSNGARVLDAGCGTGLLTLSLLKAVSRPVRVTAVDLSSSSIETAKKAVAERFGRASKITFTQADVLALPFANGSFEMIVTSGALEYVPLQDGLKEMARVLAPGGYMLHLPVRPSPVSKLLEVMFRFKTHPPQSVADHTNRYFRIVKHYRFPPLDPIGWSKSAILARKV